MACCLAAGGLFSPMSCWPIFAPVHLSSCSTGEFARFVSQPNISVLFGSALLVGSLLDSRWDTSVGVLSH